MTTSGLRITPVYAAPATKRTADDVVRDMENLGIDAFEAVRVIEAFDVCAEDYALLAEMWGEDGIQPSGHYEIRLIGHEKSAVIREAKP